MAMRRTLILIWATLPLFAGGNAGAEPSQNQLSAQERKDGWELLFDGKTVNQWRGYQKTDLADQRWIAQDGCLAVPPNDGKDTRGARDIVSVKQYQDFDLRWEWRISPGGNSGVKYLVSEDRPIAFGHEYQIIDDSKHPDAQKKDSRRTGSFYDVLPAPTAKPRPAGTFNQSRVLLQGTHVEHWLNGSKILEYELDTPSLRTAIAASKFKDLEGFDKPKLAHILIQDHGDNVCYRNLKIRPLKPAR